MPPDAWLRGPVEGIVAELQPVAHALLQAREDLERVVPELPPDSLWVGPGRAASPGFHLRHLAGSTERLLAYARGEPLSDAERRRLAVERDPDPGASPEELLHEVQGVFTRVLDHLTSLEASALDTPRSVGSARLPSNVRGLLFHLAEHATRHTGQLVTTWKAGASPTSPSTPPPRAGRGGVE